MTGHQRLHLALTHREADRVPFDLGSSRVTGITAAAYRRLRNALVLPPHDVALADLVQGLADPREDLLRRLEVDTRGLFPRPPSAWRREFAEAGGYRSFKDEWGITWTTPTDGGLYYDPTQHPLAGPITVADVQAYPWPDGRELARVAGLREQAVRLAEQGSALVLVGITSGVTEQAMRLRGLADFYCDAAADLDLAAALMDAVLEVKLGYWQTALAEVGDLVQVVAESDDLASQRGLTMSRGTYLRLIKPRHQRLFDFIHRASGARVFLHSCGAVRELIPDFIEAGVDILNPVQVSAQGMDTAQLKREFGDALTFWGGGVDTQHVLPRGTPQQVRDEVHRRIDDLAPGGGFVFTPVHNIQADVPPDNIVAMWEAMREYGRYGA